VTLEPDGTAAASGTDAKRWSAATSEFDSHRRFFVSNGMARPTAHAALSFNEAVGNVRSVHGF
jgi:hypothetical protein